MKMTSAYANKLLKQLDEEKTFWTNKEEESCVYVASTDEEPFVPEYDYEEVDGKIAELDAKICAVKHAINVANVGSAVSVRGKVMSVDQILVTMAQKNKRKTQLDFMRKQQPKKRLDDHYWSSSITPEYQYINYSLDRIRPEYKRVTQEIMDMQLALDHYNQTVEFEVDI